MTEENFIDFNCPYCQGPVSFPQDAAGFIQECPNCAEVLIVPKDGAAAGGALPFPITTERLVLRRLHLEDWKDLLGFLADDELFSYTRPFASDEEGVLRWLDNDQHVKLTTPGQWFSLGIQSRATGKVIGCLMMMFTDAQRLQAEVTAVVSRPHQRQGMATEALAVLLSFCFDGISLHRVTARCDSRHTAACRLLEKVGLRREGEFIQDQQVNGEWANTVWHAILGREYRKPDEPSAGDVAG